MNLYLLASDNNLLISETILIIILLCLAIIFCSYGIIAARKVAIAAKKFDYFIEDLTYKSEMLNSTVDTVVKISNYVDVFEAFTKRNVKAWIKVISRNKDVAYRLVDKLKDFANSEDD
ncbi:MULTISPECIES: hypothetical protein [Spiroplasma]|uniref:Transmembrane protein n=1 Tax=Spiroplasma eriocheiris TaxID=315358 RepID=A0A0H3XM26_9MOLU|nr:hypothetical protein [Spiroplasma eriocheiris]AHF58209.1 hypothetical protein SPE_1094 [Spiroplasma eriocheiris CCTCC M 207170]AKM54644.1 hypothetical protein SERIO_v1c10910 [Spiroplasma eriocheiris]